VDDIASAAFLSARQLERRFMASLDRGVNEELRRKRLEEARQLLISTDLTIAKIAPLVGFRSTTYLHRTFRAAFGMTPAQYRRKHP
jgi:transcriptional regulator GlxA family with amidase domain